MSFSSFSDEGALLASSFSNMLPRAWQIATNGLSQVQVVRSESDVRIVVLSTSGVSYAASGTVTLYTKTLHGAETPLVELLHELGHVLGCCAGEGTVDGHWIDCADRGLLCDEGVHVGTTRFSERELRALGLKT